MKALKSFVFAIALCALISACDSQSNTILPTLAVSENTSEATAEASADTSLNLATSEPGVTPTIDAAGTFGAISTLSPITDAEVGQQIGFTGVMSVVQENGVSVILLTSGDGTVVELAGGAEFGLLSGREVQAVGTIIRSPNAADEAQRAPRVVLQVSSVSEVSLLDSGATGGITGLQSYDRLLPLIEEEVAGFAWVLLSGNRNEGWVAGYLNPTTQTIVSFRLANDGSATRLTDAPAALVSAAPLLPLDRTQITIDSPAVEQAALNAGMDMSLQLPLLFLTSREEGKAEWVVNSPEGISVLLIDAATGVILTPEPVQSLPEPSTPPPG